MCKAYQARPLLEKVHAVVAEAHFQVQMCKAPQGWTTFGSCHVETVYAVWRETHFQVKMLKAPHVRTTFGRSDAFAPCQKRAKREGFVAVSKALASVGH